MQYLLLPFRPEQFTALLDRATEPEYGPVIAVSTAAGLRALPFANIEYLECTPMSGFDLFNHMADVVTARGKEAAVRARFKAWMEQNP